MSEDQQLEADIGKVSSERQPWTEAWEQAWEAYQAQQKPGGDEILASFATVRSRRMMRDI
jgi:hypothetical protein